MSQLIRRDAICTLAGTAAAVLWGTPAAEGSPTAVTSQNAVLATGTLTPEQRSERKLTGFLETGVAEGQAFCSLVEQDERNPMVMSVFAAPQRQGSRLGVQVTICFFAEPVGDIRFSLLHVGETSAPRFANERASG